MKASQLIIELQKAIQQHGDLPVVAYDGGDPADRELVQEVERCKEYIWIDGQGKPNQDCLFIRSA